MHIADEAAACSTSSRVTDAANAVKTFLPANLRNAIA